jgi:hypothetical protein
LAAFVGSGAMAGISARNLADAFLGVTSAFAVVILG